MIHAGIQMTPNNRVLKKRRGRRGETRNGAKEEDEDEEEEEKGEEEGATADACIYMRAAIVARTRARLSPVCV